MLSLLTALASAQPEPPLSTPDLPPPPSVSSVEIVYTGGTGGIGSGTWRFPAVETLAARLREAGADAVALRAAHGAMARGDQVILAEDLRVASLVGFLDGGAVSCDEGVAVRVARSESELVLLDRASAEALEAGGERWTVRTCTAASGLVARLAGPPELGIPSGWDGFEFRLVLGLSATLEGRAVRAESIGLPVQDAARRVGLLARLLEERPQALFVDAGAFVDGASSVRDGALSLHRPTGFATLRRLEPAALVPDAAELAGGVPAFLEEARGLPYLATNWKTRDDALELPASIVREVDGPEGTVRVAFLGVIGPAVMRWVPQIVEDGVLLTSPLGAVQAEIDRLRRGPDPPDLVVVLTVAQGPVLRTLQSELRGADLLLGDPVAPTDRQTSVQVGFRASMGEGTRPAFTVPLEGVGVATVTLDARPGRLVDITLAPHRVSADLPPDPAVQTRIIEVRKTEYPPLDRPLVPAPARDPAARVDASVWAKVVCEAVLEHTGAHIGLLPTLPQGAPIPGPLTELLVVDRLAILDTLEVHAITGDKLQSLLDKAYEVVPSSCGTPLGVPAVVQGRPVDPARVYRVVTTDRLRQDGTVEGLLRAGRSSRLLDQPTVRVLRDDAGEPVTLRAATLSVLRAHRDAGAPDVLGTLLARSPDDLPPLWLLRANHLLIAVSRFKGAEDPDYATIPETLATSPSTLTVNAEVDLALDYSSQKLRWDLRARGAYTRLDSAGTLTEPADDIRLTTSGSLPGAALSLGGDATVMPYAEAMYDTELTAVDPTVPQQQDGSLTLGGQAQAGVLKTVRLGAFALRDLADPDKATEFGGRTEILAEVGFGPELGWTTVADGYLFADTPDQNETDLRFKLLVDSRLALPLARWLSIAAYGQVFAFAGRGEVDHGPRAAWTVGSALDIAGAFAL